jgi:hypothetical protein
VQSADACANLSSIEILWYLGKNCLIEHWNCSYHRSLSHVDPHLTWVSTVTHSFVEYQIHMMYCITCMLCTVPMLIQVSSPLKSHGVWARIALASPEPFIHRSLSIDPHVHWLSIDPHEWRSIGVKAIELNYAFFLTDFTIFYLLFTHTILAIY